MQNLARLSYCHIRKERINLRSEPRLRLSDGYQASPLAGYWKRKIRLEVDLARSKRPSEDV